MWSRLCSQLITIAEMTFVGLLVGAALLLAAHFVMLCGLRLILALGLIGGAYGWMATTSRKC